ncbi:hypothetical protein AVEN_267114-1 [Araneus ventricosus]|uniref:Uncharacterized protein n=1 Tax=Araneus ventricosus TaxID=182803 RepID=A0A4Y2W8Y5_ARAVE|nr:hypothetical protein AVEN_267114-1 [Araneus ventricosus]
MKAQNAHLFDRLEQTALAGNEDSSICPAQNSAFSNNTHLDRVHFRCSLAQGDTLAQITVIPGLRQFLQMFGDGLLTLACLMYPKKSQWLQVLVNVEPFSTTR